MRSILFVLILLSSCCLQAKAQLSDSLYKALPDTLRPKNKRAVTAQERINIITDISPTFLLHYYEEFKAMSHQLEKDIDTVQDKTEKIPYADAIAIFYMSTDERDNYFKWEKKLVDFGKDAKKYRFYICWAYTNMAIYYSGQGKQDSAIALLHKGLTVANQGRAAENLRPIMYYGYIQIYRQLALYRSALEYANKYLQAVPQKDKWNAEYTEVALVSKTSAYVALFRDEKKNAYADSARRVIKEVMLAKKAEASYWYFLCYFYLGLLDYYNQDYRSAIGYFNTSLSPVYEETQGFRFYLPQLYKNAALISLGRSEGVAPLLTLTIPAKDYNGHRESSRILYQYYKQHGDYQKALVHYTQYEAYSDSLDVIGQKGKVFEAEQKYSVAQKEAAIAVLETRNLQADAFRNKVIVTAIISVLLLAIIALLLYQRNKRQQAQRLLERQRMADELHSMELELELDRLRQQAENEAAIVGQRKAISKNMHDEVSSDLAAVRYFIADLKGRVKTTEARRVLADVEDEVQTVYQQSRDFMHRLNESNVPEVYNVFNLLENLSLRFGKDSTLQIHTKADAQLERKLTARQQAELYKIIKEAVANCLKHSGASRMDIGIDERGDTITLDISDNGQGVKADPGHGLGMTTMRERIGSLGGDLEISPSERGLHIHASFPKVA